MLLEEWDDHIQKIATAMNCVQVHVLAVIVVSRVHVHAADAEELTKIVKHADASSALHHNEVVIDLIAGSVASSIPSIRLPDEADGEATFSVYETSDPSRVDRSFLLIVWLIVRAMNTSRVVARHHTVDIGSALMSIGGSARCSSIWSDFSKAAVSLNLRTVHLLRLITEGRD